MLERNRLLAAKWYEIFFSRLDLLVPKAALTKYRDTVVGDVVLFVFIDNPIPKMNVWKLGRVTAIVSRTTVEIRYTSTPGGPPKKMRRAAHQYVLVHAVDELPPMSSHFFEDRPSSEAQGDGTPPAAEKSAE